MQMVNTIQLELFPFLVLVFFFRRESLLSVNHWDVQRNRVRFWYTWTKKPRREVAFVSYDMFFPAYFQASRFDDCLAFICLIRDIALHNKVTFEQRPPVYSGHKGPEVVLVHRVDMCVKTNILPSHLSHLVCPLLF